MDLVIAIVQRELDELLPRLNFQENIRNAKGFFFEVIRPFLIRYCTRFFNYLNTLNKPRALTGNEVLSLHTDLLQYKRKRDSSFDDSDTEDDAISFGASTSGVSGAGKIKSAEFESEMNRIRENMNNVFEQKLKQQAEDFETRIKKLEEEMVKKFQSMQMGDVACTPQSVRVTEMRIPQAPPLPPSNQLFKPLSVVNSIPSKMPVPVTPASTPKGYDYRTELQLSLAKRRKAIERDENHHFEDIENRPKKTVTNSNPIVSSILKAVPAPSSSPRSTCFLTTKNDSYQTDEEEWK